jgi:hypothetical protein
LYFNPIFLLSFLRLIHTSLSASVLLQRDLEEGLNAITEFNETNTALRQAVGVNDSDCLVLEARKVRRGKRTPVVDFLVGITEKAWLTSPSGEALKHDLDIHGGAIRDTSPAWVDVLAVNATSGLAKARSNPEDARKIAIQTGLRIDGLVNIFSLPDIIYFNDIRTFRSAYALEDWHRIVTVYAQETIDGTVTTDDVLALSGELIATQAEYSSNMARARAAMGVPYAPDNK